MNRALYAMIVFSGTLTFAGCAPRLPDLSLARRAASEGNRDVAHWHLEQLADRGYAEAWVDLGDLEREQNSARAEYCYRQALDRDPRAALRLGKLLAKKKNPAAADIQQAQYLLTAAVGRGDEQAFQALISLYAAHPNRVTQQDVLGTIEQAQKAGIASADYGLIVWWRGKGVQADHLAEIEQICTRGLDRMDGCWQELASAYILGHQKDKLNQLLQQMRDAYDDGRLDAGVVEGVADVLSGSGATADRIREALALYERIIAESPRSLLRQARLIIKNPYLADKDHLLLLVNEIRKRDPDQGEFLLGRLYYEGRVLPLDPARAEQCFLTVVDRLPRAGYYLGQIYRKGYLGRPDHGRALRYLLAAARAGSPRADYALAEMFARGRGIRASQVYGLLFATLASEQGIEKGVALRDRLQEEMSPEQRQLAAVLLERENAFRRHELLSRVHK